MVLPMFEQMIGKLSLKQVVMLNHKFAITNYFYYLKFGQALDGKVWVMSLLGDYFICWGIYESILVIEQGSFINNKVNSIEYSILLRQST